MPEFVQVIQALAVPVLAVFAVAISLMQWRVQKRKLIIDLFDKRFNAYQDVDSALSKIFQLGASEELLHEFNRARLNSYFLFGSDVNEYLLKMYYSIVEILSSNDELKFQDNPDERKKIATQLAGARREINSFFTEGRKLYEQYMKMDEKRDRFGY